VTHKKGSSIHGPGLVKKFSYGLTNRLFTKKTACYCNYCGKEHSDPLPRIINLPEKHRQQQTLGEIHGPGEHHSASSDMHAMAVGGT